MKPRTVLFAPFICALIACGDDALLSRSELRELTAAESRWAARGFADYTYEIQQLCFCPVEINAWTRVTVRGGHVTAAVHVDDGSVVPAEMLQAWTPVDSLFARLRSTESGSSNVYSDIIVTFDSQLGFPTYIEWKERPNIADAGAVYHLRNVTPLTST